MEQFDNKTLPFTSLLKPHKSPQSDPDGVKWRKMQARWRFYGELGTLRLIQTKMYGISRLWPKDHAIQQLTGEIEAKTLKLLELMLAHKDDWRGTI